MQRTNKNVSANFLVQGNSNDSLSNNNTFKAVPSRCKTGYLFKKGRGLSLAILKPWSYRWFSLDLATGILRYYSDEEGCVN